MTERLPRTLLMFPSATLDQVDKIASRIRDVTWKLERAPSGFRIVMRRPDGYEFACDFEDISVRRRAFAMLMRACACQPLAWPQSVTVSFSGE